MKVQTTLAMVALMAVVGCTPATHRGSVAMKVSEQEAHVCMGVGEVKAGDRVALYRDNCDRSGLPSKGVSGFSEVKCNRVRLGEGQVVRTLNEHYSVVEIDPGVEFEEGVTVEKL
jgi:hypothetical protein